MITVHYRNLVTVNVKCLHVLYDSYGPPTLYGIDIWWSPLPYMEQVWYGPLPCMYVPPTCEVSSCLYMTLSTPYLIWNRYCMVPHMYVWSSPTCTIWFFSGPPYLIYGIGFLCSSLPYMEQVSYGPPHMYIWSPHMKCLHVSWLMVPYTLYGIGIWWSPLTLYGTGIVWSPHVCKVPSCIIWLLWSLIPYME